MYNKQNENFLDSFIFHTGDQSLYSQPQNDHPQPSQKSIERKMRKLLLFGHTHSGPRKRKKKKRQQNKKHSQKNNPQPKGRYTSSGLFIPYNKPKSPRSQLSKSPKLDSRKQYYPLFTPNYSDFISYETKNSSKIQFKQHQPSKLPLNNAETTASRLAENLFSENKNFPTIPLIKNLKRSNTAPNFSAQPKTNLNSLLADLVSFLPDPELLTLRSSLQLDLCQKLKKLGIYSQNYTKKEVVEDYSIVCVYSFKGCNHVCQKSKLEEHLKNCEFMPRDLVLETEYNPLEYILSCPYKISGCTYSCKRKDLTKHLNICSFRLDLEDDKLNYLNIEQVQYQLIVCPNAIMGCEKIIKRNDVEKHLETCSFGVRKLEENSRKERIKNKEEVVSLAEKERDRRIKLGKLKSFDKNMIHILNSIRATKKLNKDKEDSKVDQIVKAAEIELLTKNLSSLALKKQKAKPFKTLFEETWTNFIKEQENKTKSNLNCIKNFIQELLTIIGEPTAQIKIYGSYAYGIVLADFSDVDLIYFGRRSYKELFHILQIKQEALKITKLEFISSASFPVLKFKFDNLCVDLTVNTQKHHGLEVKQFLKEATKDYKTRLLILFIKLLLAKNDLHLPYSGGLSSFGLILMSIASIGKTKVTSSFEPSLLGLIKEFLLLFGSNFDSLDEAVLFEQITFQKNKVVRLVYVGYRKGIFPEDHLVLVDPTNRTNNVGKSCFQFPRIQTLFMQTLEHLEHLEFSKSNNVIGIRLLQQLFGKTTDYVYKVD
eukprot:snap_masked-scaffold_44-processed-gene-1.17-mRNA-1 protein AED:1.00 eAED:1.00 QI:0/0/0/0/1/1/2/0/766